MIFAPNSPPPKLPSPLSKPSRPSSPGETARGKLSSTPDGVEIK
ncbi:hypothetical protein PF008_g5327 [Phytophthora fragariae]|uniref:Uncharacterized protein n=1 Tax=Phytophthora fragariae TaxID=53985 RepID=A0A6G0S9R4_9STRA|nr:hypothetical protein PF008_g5327 [Phytophthora fragariae]